MLEHKPCKGCDDMPLQEAGTGLIVGIAKQDSEIDSVPSVWSARGGVVTSDDNNIFRLTDNDGLAIDFSKYSVLFQYTSTGGCFAVFLRDVVKDDNNKKYIYTITDLRCGNLEPLYGHLNIVIIPKIEEGYSVEIIEKTARWVHHKIKNEYLNWTYVYKKDSDGSWKLESKTKHY